MWFMRSRKQKFAANLTRSFARLSSTWFSSVTLSLSPDGLLAFPDEEKIVLIDVVEGVKRELSIPYHSKVDRQVRALAFSPDGKKLASIYYSSRPEGSEYAIWDSETWNILFKGRFGERLEEVFLSTAPQEGSGFVEFRARLEDIHPTCTALSLTGDKLAVGTQYGEVYLVDVQSSKDAALGGHGPSVVPAALGDYVEFVAFSPDGEKLISGGADANVIVWNITGRKGKRSGKILVTHDYALSSGALSPDGSILATSNMYGRRGEEAGEIRVWDTTSEKLVKKLKGGASLLSFTGTGHLFSYHSVENEEGRVMSDFIRAWRTNGWKLESTVKLNPRFCGEIFSPDGKYLAGSLLKEGFEIWSLY